MKKGSFKLKTPLQIYVALNCIYRFVSSALPFFCLLLICLLCLKGPALIHSSKRSIPIFELLPIHHDFTMKDIISEQLQKINFSSH